MKKRRRLSVLIYASIIISLAIGVAGASLAAFWAVKLKIPDPQSFNQRKIIQSTKIYDRTGKVLLWDIHKDIKRTVVPFENISRYAKNATVAIEDDNFYHHHGIDIKAIIRAFIANLKSGGVRQGGSTISQQVVKNTMLTPERSITRKIKEIILTLKLEKKLSKDKILEIYLNEAPYGGNIYGIEEASQSFFGKPSSDLTLAEAAYLAALPKAPTYYSPYGSHRKELEERKNLVLKRMLELGFITQKEWKEAMTEKVHFLEKSNQAIKAPHFSLFIRSYLEKKYGKDLVEQGGLKVITTLNYELQEKAEKLVKEYAEKNTEKFKAYNAGLVAIDPKSGQILAMVGSRDWSEDPLPEGCTPGLDCKFEPKPNVVAYGIGRQPGSAIKPFVYAAAFKKGYTPETVVFDLKTEFNTLCNAEGTPKEGVDEKECYMPQNSDGIFRGPLTFRSALAQSLNVPSVKVLYLAGLKNALKLIRQAGITTMSDDPNKYGLTLVLGGGEVSLLELTNAYSIFANKGEVNPPSAILKIEDSKGNILEEYKSLPKRVIDEKTAETVTDILSDNQARAPMFGEHSPLHIPDYDVAAKTGTTNDFRDAWTIGYTPNLIVGVWVGNNDNSPMEYKTASFIAAPLWNAVMKEFLPLFPKEKFAKPPKEENPEELKPVLRGIWQGSRSYKIDKISGKLATEFTPPDLIEEKVLTQIHSILYWVDKDNPRGPIPEHPENDPQFELWEKPVRQWAKNQHIREQTIQDIPKDKDDVHLPQNAPRITILYPRKNEIYNPKNILNVKIRTQSKFGVEQVDFFLNNVYLGSSKTPPFNFSFIPASAAEPAPSSVLKIVAYDKVRNKKEVSLPLRFSLPQPQ